MKNIKIHGITYGDENFKSSRDKAYISLKKYTDAAYLFTETDLNEYKDKIDSKILYPGARGGGHWIFKPIFLKYILNNIPDGEAVIWMDAGNECVADIRILADIAANHEGFCLFQQVHKNSHYTKRDCFYYMNNDSLSYYNSRQCDASMQLYIKNEKTLKFIDEYLHFCSDYRIVTDRPNECNLPNLEGFIDHRHDQSILTNLVVTYDLDTFIQPSQWYSLSWNTDDRAQFLNTNERIQSERYSTLFNHHRERY